MLQGGTPARLLIRHFVRRFVDNDFLSAHADRHESLAFFAATLVSAGMFGAVLIGAKYLFGVPSVSWAAVSVMDDMFVIVSVSMIVVALTTAAQWDALSIDARDAAILGPLPVGHPTIVRAKAAANLLFGSALVMTTTVPASLIFSFVALASLRLAASTEMRVIASHVLTTTLAGLFAFIAVVALREGLRLLTGARGFARISSFVQVLLVVGLTTLLLLVLGGDHAVPRAWLQTPAPRSLTPLVVPAMWFVGLAQTINGDVIVLAPVGGVVVDDDLSRFYLAQTQVFRDLAGTAFIGTATPLLLGSAAFFWNARRLPSPIAPARQRARVVRRALSEAAIRTVVRRPMAQAAFFFTFRVLFRSRPHRLTLAVGAAVALSMTIAVVTGVGQARGGEPTTAPLLWWALQPLVLMTIAATLQHAMALPAELPANWIFHHCWAGQLRACVAGAARAAFVGVMAPAVLMLVPLHVYVMGPGAGLFHAMNGLLLSAALLGFMMMDRTAPPFLSSYVRSGNVKSLSPIVVMVAVGLSLTAAAFERSAVGSTAGSLRHTLALCTLVLVIHQTTRRRLPSSATLATAPPELSADPLRLSG